MGKRKLSRREAEKLKEKIRKLEKAIYSTSSDSSETESSSSADSSTNQEMNQVVTQAIVHNPTKGHDQLLDNSLDPYESLLGISPNAAKSQGPPLLEDIALRYRNYISEGLDKDLKASLVEKWKIPENCTFLTPPKPNPEVSALMSVSESRKDNFLVAVQELLSNGITALGSDLSKAIQNDPNNSDLEMLVNSGQMLCEVQRTLTSHRRFRLNYLMSSQIQQIAQKSKAHEFLYGSKFGKDWKALKAAETIGKEMRAPLPASLNYKVQSNKARFKAATSKRREKGKLQTKKKRYEQKNKSWDSQRRRQ